MEPSRTTDQDLSGSADCLLLRLLDHDNIDTSDREALKNWKFHQSSKKAYLDEAEQIYWDIPALKRAQKLLPAATMKRSIDEEIVERGARVIQFQNRWKVVFLKGVVLKKVTEIEQLKTLIARLSRKISELNSVIELKKMVSELETLFAE